MELYLRDKFEQDFEILGILLDNLEKSPRDLDSIRLALAEAKRVRRTCTFLVQHLAALRDNATEPGGSQANGNTTG